MGFSESPTTVAVCHHHIRRFTQRRGLQCGVSGRPKSKLWRRPSELISHPFATASPLCSSTSDSDETKANNRSGRDSKLGARRTVGPGMQDGKGVEGTWAKLSEEFTSDEIGGGGLGGTGMWTSSSSLALSSCPCPLPVAAAESSSSAAAPARGQFRGPWRFRGWGGFSRGGGFDGNYTGADPELVAPKTTSCR